jgi:hypothetical protein
MLLSFRLVAAFIVIAIGPYSIAGLAAEIVRPERFMVDPNVENLPSPEKITAAEWVAAIAPLRSDLGAEHAVALTDQALTERSSSFTKNGDAQIAVVTALAWGPHDARLWLALALLQSQRNANDPLVTESFKMSYFAGSGQLEIVLSRLNLVTQSTALKDPELNELACGDVRTVFLHYPSYISNLAEDYRQASTFGQAALENCTRSIEPKYVDILKSPN